MSLHLVNPPKGQPKHDKTKKAGERLYDKEKSKKNDSAGVQFTRIALLKPWKMHPIGQELRVKNDLAKHLTAVGVAEAPKKKAAPRPTQAVAPPTQKKS